MLRKVTIKNFKSIQEISLTLPKFGAVIGKNGSGKTNLISAVFLLKKLVEGTPIEKARRDGLSFFPNEFFFMGNDDDEAEFEFQFEGLNSIIYTYCYSIIFSPENSNDFVIGKESLLKDGELVFRRKLGTEGNVYDGKNHVPYGVQEGSLILENYVNDDVMALKELILDYTIVDAPVSAKNEFQVITNQDLRLDTIDGVATSLYVKDEALLSKAVESVKKIIPDFIAPEIVSLQLRKQQDKDSNKKQGEYLVMWSSSIQGQRCSHYSISHGDRKVIHLIFSLFNTRTKAILIAEEIENGMHYGRLEKLIDQLRTQAYNLKIQLLFTTHSSQLLNDLKPAEVIYCRKNADGATLIDLLTDTDEFKAVKDELSGEDVTASTFVNAGLFD